MRTRVLSSFWQWADRSRKWKNTLARYKKKPDTYFSCKYVTAYLKRKLICKKEVVVNLSSFFCFNSSSSLLYFSGFVSSLFIFFSLFLSSSWDYYRVLAGHWELLVPICSTKDIFRWFHSFILLIISVFCTWKPFEMRTEKRQRKEKINK